MQLLQQLAQGALGQSGPQKRTNGWDCRCGALDNRPTRATCRQCDRPAPKAFLRRLAAREKAKAEADRLAGKGDQGSKPEAFTPSWAEIAAGAPPGRKGPQAASTPGGKADQAPAPTPTPNPSPEDDPATKKVKSEVKMARAMLNAAKTNSLDAGTIKLWEDRLAAANRKLEELKPPEAQLRSLLDRKKSTEDKLQALVIQTDKLRQDLKDKSEEADLKRRELADIAEQVALLQAPKREPEPVQPGPRRSAMEEKMLEALVLDADPERQRAIFHSFIVGGWTAAEVTKAAEALRAELQGPSRAKPSKEWTDRVNEGMESDEDEDEDGEEDEDDDEEDEDDPDADPAARLAAAQAAHEEELRQLKSRLAAAEAAVAEFQARGGDDVDMNGSGANRPREGPPALPALKDGPSGPVKPEVKVKLEDNPGAVPSGQLPAGVKVKEEQPSKPRGRSRAREPKGRDGQGQLALGNKDRDYSQVPPPKSCQ